MTGRRCITCSGWVEVAAIPEHDQWHERIANVAIENTKRIDEFTARIQELEAGYGDR